MCVGGGGVGAGEGGLSYHSNKMDALEIKTFVMTTERQIWHSVPTW